MPGFDGTGPAGRGPGTGGGRGLCSGARRRPGRFANRYLDISPFAQRRGAGLRRGLRRDGSGGGPPEA